MVSREVVLETVKKMISQGIEDSVIESTLEDIGLGEQEISEVIAEARGTGKKAASKAPEPEEETTAEAEGREAEEELEGEEEKPAVAKPAPLVDQGLVNSSVHVAVETQGQKLEELHQNVSQLHEKLDSYSQAGAEQLSLRLGAIEKKLDEVSASVADSRALNSALQDLMQKILEANRRMIAGLEKK